MFDFGVCTPRPGRVRGGSGFDLYVERGLDAAADADLVCFSPHREFRSPDPAVVELARKSHERGAMVFAHCSAAFMLGEAGLLDGRECTTHWRYTDELPRRPRGEGPARRALRRGRAIVTGAGSAAGIDASLHLMRRCTARRWPPTPPGGSWSRRTATAARPSSSYADGRVRGRDARAAADLDPREPRRAAVGRGLAARSAMSPRTFARRFVDETGATPPARLTASAYHGPSTCSRPAPAGGADRRPRRLRLRRHRAPPVP